MKMVSFANFQINKFSNDDMETITLDKKKYVILEKKEYDALQKKAVLGNDSGKKLLTLKEAKAYGYKLIDKWHKEKLESSSK